MYNHTLVDTSKADMVLRAKSKDATVWYMADPEHPGYWFQFYQTSEEDEDNLTHAIFITRLDVESLKMALRDDLNNAEMWEIIKPPTRLQGIVDEIKASLRLS